MKILKQSIQAVIVLALFLAGRFVYGQTAEKALGIDIAIKEAAQAIDARLAAETVVAFINFNSATEELSSFCLNQLETEVINLGNLRVVERRRVDEVRGQIEFQVTGEVNTESARRVGQRLGADVLISGSVNEVDGVYRLVTRVLVVRTAVVAAQYRADIKNDSRFYEVSNYRGYEKDMKKKAREALLEAHPYRAAYYGLGLAPNLSIGFDDNDKLLSDLGADAWLTFGYRYFSLDAGLNFQMSLYDSNVEYSFGGLWTVNASHLINMMNNVSLGVGGIHSTNSYKEDNPLNDKDFFHRFFVQARYERLLFLDPTSDTTKKMFTHLRIGYRLVFNDLGNFGELNHMVFLGIAFNFNGNPFNP